MPASLKTRRLAAVSVIGLALTATARPGYEPGRGCDDGDLHGGHDGRRSLARLYVNGRPAGINPHTTDAIVHVARQERLAHAGDAQINEQAHRSAGRSRPAGSSSGVKPVRLEKSDKFAVSARTSTRSRSCFKNYGVIDHSNFRTHARAPSLSLSASSPDGKTSPAQPHRDRPEVRARPQMQPVRDQPGVAAGHDRCGFGAHTLRARR